MALRKEVSSALPSSRFQYSPSIVDYDGTCGSYFVQPQRVYQEVKFTFRNEVTIVPVILKSVNR